MKVARIERENFSFRYFSASNSQVYSLTSTQSKLLVLSVAKVQSGNLLELQVISRLQRLIPLEEKTVLEGGFYGLIPHLRLQPQIFRNVLFWSWQL